MQVPTSGAPSALESLALLPPGTPDSSISWCAYNCYRSTSKQHDTSWGQFSEGGSTSLLCVQGQVAVTASIDFILANHLASMVALSTGRVLTNSELLGVLGGKPIPQSLAAQGFRVLCCLAMPCRRLNSQVHSLQASCSCMGCSTAPPHASPAG